MKTIKYTLLHNWHLARWVRLLLGILVTVQAWQIHSGILAVLAAILLYQAAMNAGCCGSAGCPVPAPRKNNIPDTEDAAAGK